MSAVPNQADEQMLLRRDEAGVTTLTLNRPMQFNSLSKAMLETLLTEIDAIAADKSVRVVVLAGEGKAFCAGHDLKEMRANHNLGFQQELFRLCGKFMVRLTEIPQPVIARIHGIATAAGCQLVSMCDLAVASDVAKFAVSGINVGLFCATPSVGLSRNMGRKEAFEMLVTGDFIDAHEAQRRGLVNRVVALDQLDDEVARLAAAIVAKSPVAVSMGKQMFYRQLEMGMDAAYQMAAETMACNMMTNDAAEGIDAFVGKRKPEWKGC
ncbi:MAG: enoyl-CoA hydratase [Betaproteobacteria bacterium HGW-Betaproteobacteria-13]|jgi:enoyl-CoA hydratase/carnithine racemase|uniref:Enoyl-CoA hydratase domain-containing protein 3, mitochondrial n=1 Tax=Parazoarcus communis TaxID=41977 RepID=A0A2U8H5N3_9RHOO|nr:enoyl-CoA hydratase [Parazoarcus communis]AWI80953.1 enoyl-CoA hydratase [Parazoarcus communis]PKO56995.1 MAG: enoyl-CoA hydratase [Betaproteobacteria bacterium HGW-Betaproteobacteria-21]PKO81833.1 MAG: enoyl-CoA hydratase [Betaproteobacteria bacterium HGW-Betaproteobacteria-13]